MVQLRLYNSRKNNIIELQVTLRHSDIMMRSLPLFVILVSTVNGHGYLSEPPSRNILAKNQNCPHCLNGGTVDDVSAKKTLRWPRGNHGLCGDSFYDTAPRNHEAGGTYYQKGVHTNYTQGQVMDIDIDITTNHNGRFGFRICKVNGGYDSAVENEKKELTEECFDQNILQQANVAGAQSPGQRWFYTNPQDPVSTAYNLHYQLPEDLVCDGQESHCVLQWYWMTFNTCQPSDAPVKYTRSEYHLRNCDKYEGDDFVFPEEFWNCADIVIQKPWMAAS